MRNKLNNQSQGGLVINLDDSSASIHDLILGIEKHPPKSNDFKPVFIFLKNGEVVIKNYKNSSTIKIPK